RPRKTRPVKPIPPGGSWPAASATRPRACAAYRDRRSMSRRPRPSPSRDRARNRLRTRPRRRRIRRKPRRSGDRHARPPGRSSTSSATRPWRSSARSSRRRKRPRRREPRHAGCGMRAELSSANVSVLPRSPDLATAPPPRLILLALETTCDETAAAVLEGPQPPAEGVPRIRSSVVASQVGLHQRYGGVVPGIASRAHVRQILPMIDEALRRADVTLRDVDAVAVATAPGLVGALVVGLTAAKALALALEVPLVAVDHLEGHLYACQLAYPDRQVYP